MTLDEIQAIARKVLSQYEPRLTEKVRNDERPARLSRKSIPDKCSWLPTEDNLSERRVQNMIARVLEKLLSQNDGFWWSEPPTADAKISKVVCSLKFNLD